MVNKSISVVIPDEMRQELDKQAAALERNISWVVRKAIEEYLEKHSKQE